MRISILSKEEQCCTIMHYIDCENDSRTHIIHFCLLLLFSLFCVNSALFLVWYRTNPKPIINNNYYNPHSSTSTTGSISAHPWGSKREKERESVNPPQKDPSTTWKKCTDWKRKQSCWLNSDDVLTICLNNLMMMMRQFTTLFVYFVFIPSVRVPAHLENDRRRWIDPFASHSIDWHVTTTDWTDSDLSRWWSCCYCCWIPMRILPLTPLN